MRPTSLLGALRGPVLLMTLGGLLAADQMETVSFSNTWPVLLILFGAMKLAERAFRPDPSDNPSGNTGANY